MSALSNVSFSLTGMLFQKLFSVLIAANEFHLPIVFRAMTGTKPVNVVDVYSPATSTIPVSRILPKGFF